MFLISLGKHVAGTRLKEFSETLLMSTHNRWVFGEMRKISNFFIEKKSAFIWSYDSPYTDGGPHKLFYCRKY